MKQTFTTADQKITKIVTYQKRQITSIYENNTGRTYGGSGYIWNLNFHNYTQLAAQLVTLKRDFPEEVRTLFAKLDISDNLVNRMRKQEDEMNENKQQNLKYQLQTKQNEVAVLNESIRNLVDQLNETN